MVVDGLAGLMSRPKDNIPVDDLPEKHLGGGL